MEKITKKQVEEMMYEAFKQSGNIGYYMLYSALKRNKEDERS